MNPLTNESLRDHLAELMRGGHAHATFDQSVADVPESLRGVQPPGGGHTLWQLLEHLRIAQWDILEFSRNAHHVSPLWPEGYWPATDAPPDAAAWDRSIEAFRAGLADMEKLVKDPANDLFARIPHGNGQTLLREAMLVADHNSYHLGQFVLVRRLLGSWQ